MKLRTDLHPGLLIVGLACLWVLGFTSTSQAISIDETITKNNGLLPGNPVTDQTISFLGLNTNPTSAATITFSVRGDFDLFSESIELSVNGFNFGTWLDDNPGNDTIAGPANDKGNQYFSILTGTASIPLANLSGLVADGNLNFFFDYSGAVGNAGDDLAQVRVQYEATDTAPIPEPGTIFLFGSGLAGLAAWRYRKHKMKA